MKFIHLSDLHLGKRVNEFSMLEEQDAILNQILGIIDTEAPDGILIARDIYDKSIPVHRRQRTYIAKIAQQICVKVQIPISLQHKTEPAQRKTLSRLFYITPPRNYPCQHRRGGIRNPREDPQILFRGLCRARAHRAPRHIPSRKRHIRIFS